MTNPTESIFPGLATPTRSITLDDRAPAQFERLLGEARATAEPDKLRRAAEGFVAGTLVLPVLAQLRASNEAAPPFQPGAYEKAFAPLFDAEIADRIVANERFGIVDRVVDSLTPGANKEVRS